MLCPKCNSEMVERNGRYGAFLGCSNFRNGCREIIKIQVGKKSYKKTVAGSKADNTPTSAVKGSEEQTAIWSAIAAAAAVIAKGGRPNHIIIEALAGTGKSFTCRHALRVLAESFPSLRCLYLAFNNSIVNEFIASIGDLPNITVKTLNAAGNQICRQAYGHRQPSDYKIENIFDAARPNVHQQGSDEYNAHRAYRNLLSRLVALCQAHLFTGNREQVNELIERFDIDTEGFYSAEGEAKRPCPGDGNLIQDLQWLILADQHTTAEMSFNDQLWFPVVNNLPGPHYDVIFVDEAQDLNACQHALVKRMLSKNGIVVACGDKHQAIYGFRGSDVDSIDNLCKLLSDDRQCDSFPLTITRRCGRVIVEEAQTYVPGIKALANAVDGQIFHTNVSKAVDLYKPGDLVVCRCNAPLCSIAFGLIRNGTKAVIRGRDIAANLVSLIVKLNASSVNELIHRLDGWRASELEKVAGTRREEQASTQINDRADCILALTEGAKSVDEIRSNIERIFSDFEADGAPRHAVILSSIHRAKGLEADRVFWALPEITIKAKVEWQQRQEQNLRYVAITRAKSELYYVAGEKKAKAKAGNLLGAALSDVAAMSGLSAEQEVLMMEQLNAEAA